jgi:hypothetical protein
MKLFTLFILFFALSGQACEYSLNYNSVHDINDLEEVIMLELAKKDFIPGNGDYSIDIKSKSIRDTDNVELFISRSTIKLNKFSKLENFTHGFGVPQKSAKKSASLAETILSLKDAISHLPKCIR